MYKVNRTTKILKNQFDEDLKLFRYISRWWEKRAQIEGSIWRRRGRRRRNNSGQKATKKREEVAAAAAFFATLLKKPKIGKKMNAFFAKLQKAK